MSGTQYTVICASFIQAQQTNQLVEFEHLISKNAKLIRVGKGTITDRAAVHNYLNSLSVYHRTQKVDYSIVNMPESDVPRVKIVINNESIIYVSFRVENSIITQIDITQEQSNNMKAIY